MLMPYRVLLFSQDRKELYVSNAIYDDEYRDYLLSAQNPMAKKKNFLK